MVGDGEGLGDADVGTAAAVVGDADADGVLGAKVMFGPVPERVQPVTVTSAKAPRASVRAKRPDPTASQSTGQATYGSMTIGVTHSFLPPERNDGVRSTFAFSVPFTENVRMKRTPFGSIVRHVPCVSV